RQGPPLILYKDITIDIGGPFPFLGLYKLIELEHILRFGYIGHGSKVVYPKIKHSVQPSFGLDHLYIIDQFSFVIGSKPIYTVLLHPSHICRRYFKFERIIFIKMLHGKIIAYLPCGIKTTDIDIIVLI